MSSESAAVGAPHRPLRPEIVLAVLGALTFALIPIHVNTIYSGLPAHPLFLHVPVILIPLVVVAALILSVAPRWFAAHGTWVAAVAVIALGATNLTIGAGDELRQDLGLTGGFGPAALIARHAHAASILRILLIAFTAVLIVSVAVFRTRDRRITGIGLLDVPVVWIRSRTASSAALRVLLAVLAVSCGYFVFHTGDLGAKAVWQDRVGGSRPGGPGGGFGGGAAGGGGGGGGGGPSSLFGPSSGG